MTTDLHWRKASYSGSNGDCVEVAVDAGVLIRNSNHPDRGTIDLAPSAMAAFVASCQAGEMDDLA